MHKTLCLCSELPDLELRTRLCFVTHFREVNKSTNTGRLASLCVRGSSVLVHGQWHQELEPIDQPERQILLLFPDDDAEVLSTRHGQGSPPTLVLPDGTWRQAKKMMSQLPWLGRLKKVTLPPDGRPSAYRLRSTQRPGALSTAEAASRALGILEGADVDERLEHVFRMMVDRTLFSRGVLPREQVFGGIPAGVYPDDPSGIRG